MPVFNDSNKHQIVTAILQIVKDVCAVIRSNRTVLQTCKGLAEASEVKESSFGQRDELTQKHQEGDGGEDHWEDHEGLDRLQPVLERRRSENHMEYEAGVKNPLTQCRKGTQIRMYGVHPLLTDRSHWKCYTTRSLFHYHESSWTRGLVSPSRTKPTKTVKTERENSYKKYKVLWIKLTWKKFKFLE